jgi:DNA-binding transcriptional MocR family regulator
VDFDAVVPQARRVGVTVSSLTGAYLGPTVHNGLLLGFGAVPTANVEEGLRRLVRVVRHQRRLGVT